MSEFLISRQKNKKWNYTQVIHISYCGPMIGLIPGPREVHVILSI